MPDNDDNFGGTKLVSENGEQMDPAIAGISPPSVPTMDADGAGEAEMKALDEESGEADVTASGAE